MKPVKLTPAFKDYLWGGRRLITDFNKKTDLEKAADVLTSKGIALATAAEVEG